MKLAPPIAATAAALALAGCASIPATTSTSASVKSSGSSASIPPPPTPAAAPSPDGKYQGACNYTIGDDPADGTAVATGDVQVTNTGNIGTYVHVTITWPQQGYAPLAMSRDVRTRAGAEKDVQFHMPLSEDQLSNLQNWQLGHDYADGCTYKATITSTFGPAQ